jgi:hypothetical protein
MAAIHHPAIKAGERYDKACARYEHALDSYLASRENVVARDAAIPQARLMVLQSAKRVRLAAWAQYAGWQVV